MTDSMIEPCLCARRPTITTTSLNTMISRYRLRIIIGVIVLVFWTSDDVAIAGNTKHVCGMMISHIRRQMCVCAWSILNDSIDQQMIRNKEQ
jgi:hypothetical protein